MSDSGAPEVSGVSGVSVDFVRLLVQYASNADKVKEVTAKYAVDVDQKTIDLTLKIAELCPELFAAIKENITEVFSDGKLDIKDVPQLVLLCVDVYESNIFKKIKGLTLKDLVASIKVTVLLLLQAGVLKPNLGISDEMLATAVNSAAMLLERVVSNKTVSSCFCC